MRHRLTESLYQLPLILAEELDADWSKVTAVFPPAVAPPPVYGNPDPNIGGIVLTVTGLIAILVSVTRGPNLGISRRTGVITGIVLLALGAALLIYGAAVPQ